LKCPDDFKLKLKECTIEKKKEKECPQEAK